MAITTTPFAGRYAVGRTLNESGWYTVPGMSTYDNGTGIFTITPEAHGAHYMNPSAGAAPGTGLIRPALYAKSWRIGARPTRLRFEARALPPAPPNEMEWIQLYLCIAREVDVPTAPTDWTTLNTVAGRSNIEDYLIVGPAGGYGPGGEDWFAYDTDEHPGTTFDWMQTGLPAPPEGGAAPADGPGYDLGALFVETWSSGMAASAYPYVQLRNIILD